jgi:hypothetical protein
MRGAPIFQVKFREQDSYIFLGEVTGEFFLLEGEREVIWCEEPTIPAQRFSLVRCAKHSTTALPSPDMATACKSLFDSL